MMRLMPFVFILLAIVIFFTYVRPTWSGQIANDKAQIASYDSALTAAANFSARETELEQEKNQIPVDEQNRLETFLPDGVDNVQLILDLNSLGTRSGVKLSNFTTGATPNAPAPAPATGTSTTPGAIGGSEQIVDSLTISMTVSGTYSAFRTFLSGIEESLRPLDVVSLTVSDSDTGVYTYQMTLKFYWLH